MRRRIASVSTGPGVYRWLDASGHVLYVGKAKNLRNRMQHYVQAAKKHSAWIEIMVRQIHDFDITVTNTELEALLLETNLIKELRPKYNVMMKDDKNYVYLRISVGDTFPRVDIVRRMEDDQPSLKLRPAGGALYFGPKTSAEQLRETLAFLRTLFPFRNCKMGISLTPDPSPDGGGEKQQGGSPFSLRGKGLGMGDRLPLEVVCRDRDRPTPCIDHHIKQCLAPCIGTVTPEQYRLQAIDGVVAFFQGKHQETERILTERMQEAAKAKKFERAAKLRNQLEKLKKTQEKQLISDTSHANTDTVGASLLSGHAYIVLLRERDGKLIGEENFSLQGTAESLADVLGQFLPQYFGALSDLPDTIVVGEEPTDREAIESWLQSLRNRRVRLVIPERGKKSKLLLLAEKNADWKARQTEAKWEAETRKTEEALKELQALLKLPVPPRRIEGYDISHLGGTHTVGSMVVFHHGKPKREHYRSFNVRTVEGKVDDYRALAEMLRRRFKYLADDLDASMKRWQEKGIVFGKARKAEQAVIVTISKAYPEDIGADAINYRHYIVARYGKEIVGFCRLFQYPGNVQTLRSLWIKKEWRGEKLGHTLIRMLLRRLTKGKLYVHISKDSLLEYYMELDFQPVRTPLPVLQKQLDVWEKAHPGSPVGMILVYIVAQQKLGESFSETPDILLIDGGKGQLGVAVQVLKEFGLEIPVAGLAKREEEIFVPGKADPLLVVQDSAARFLLQRVRDEAHRFANSKREGRQKASTFHSQLDEIPGIGEATKKALLKRFGTADAVFAAADEELRQILTQSQVDELRKG
ncbi:MAG: GNAT family N-acetyltransferase [Candidatus Peribacteraceae bacterium]